tara:strand:+ start:1204 stop:1668 length:465 start_codon:yes stop_codon:yes gene_type:complete
MDDLIDKVKQWHHDRNLIDGSTDLQQFNGKLLEEVKELETNILLSQPIADDIGDILVVLINIATRNNLSLSECLQVAYDDIKDRKGKMVDGVFIKERETAQPNTTEKDIIYLRGFEDGKRQVIVPNLSEEFGHFAIVYNNGYNAGLIHEKGGRL